ncbi:MAG: hypothetical protein HS115_06420 [Spirochaetales bacterium]|nr:hypothetical protein [Spirochaetales bacterium]
MQDLPEEGRDAGGRVIRLDLDGDWPALSPEEEQRIQARFDYALKHAAFNPDHKDAIICRNYFQNASGLEGYKRVRRELRVIGEYMQEKSGETALANWKVEASRSGEHYDLVIERRESPGVIELPGETAPAVQEAGKSPVEVETREPWYRNRKIQVALMVGGTILAGLSMDLWRRFQRKRKASEVARLLSQETDITQNTVNRIFGEDWTEERVSRFLAFIHDEKQMFGKIVDLPEEYSLGNSGLTLAACTADSRGRIAALEEEGILIASDLERGSRTYLLKSADRIQTIFNENGAIQERGYRWFDLKRMDLRSLDHVSMTRPGAAILFAILGSVASGLLVENIWKEILPPLASLAIIATAAITVRSLFEIYSLVEKGRSLKKRLIRSFLAFKSRSANDGFVEMQAASDTVLRLLIEEFVCILDDLKPGESIFVQRNHHGDVIQIYNENGKSIRFFDYEGLSSGDAGNLRFRADPTTRTLLLVGGTGLALATGWLLLSANLILGLLFGTTAFLTAAALILYFLNFLKHERKRVLVSRLVSSWHRLRPPDQPGGPGGSV